MDPDLTPPPGRWSAYAIAQYSLGVAYWFGAGVEQDDAAAAVRYLLAAEQGNAAAQFMLGVAYGQGRRRDSERGDGSSTGTSGRQNRETAGAQNNLGTAYEHGEGVPQDYTQAAVWYRLAAEQGEAVAQSNLGGMYRLGRGVPQDYVKAMTWYRRAAEQGNSSAQNNLGAGYLLGNGVPQDYVEAHMWFNLAAAQGSDLAAGSRDEVARHMTREQLAEAHRRAPRAVSRAADDRAPERAYPCTIGPFSPRILHTGPA